MSNAYWHCADCNFGSNYEEDASIHQHNTGHTVKPEWL